MVNKVGNGNFLPMSVLQKMAKISLNDGRVDDHCWWKWTSHGEFTVRSAYEQFKAEVRTNDEGLRKSIWKLNAPQRCRSFLWLCARNRLLTDKARWMRGMPGLGGCDGCRDTMESSLHVVRDCVHAKQLWSHILSHSLAAQFTSFHDITDWIRWNSGQWHNVEGVPWGVWFAVGCRNVWLACNMRIFEGLPTRPPIFKAQTRAMVTGYNRKQVLPMEEEEVSLIWKPPPIGTLKVNVDRARSQVTGEAACGGVMRDWQGRVLKGFLFHIGQESSITAEASGVIMGLRMPGTWVLGM